MTMVKRLTNVAAAFAVFTALGAVSPGTAVSRDDFRLIGNGFEIPSEGYCDQPYVVVNGDGSWTCVMTTGGGREGATGQHIIAVRSFDRGKTWTEPVAIEPADGPEASWALPLKTPAGRIYVFYTYNIDDMREVEADTDYARRRVDTLGAFVFKYSDDNGVTWSAKRYPIPVRLMDIDRDNPYGGAVRFFWGVGKPIVHGGAMYLGFSKVGRFGEGFIARSQGCFLKSADILTEADPEKITFETLPAGDTGLVSPEGPIAEETSLAGLSDGSLYCTYRSVAGHPCHAYSRDGGRTWTGSAFMTYVPGGRPVKHPRAANFVWKASNGKFLYWFHNHGGADFDGRNPAWISGGVERNGFIHWSQPEILLYDDAIGNRISYPDFIEQDGRYFITETQKSIARVHEIPAAFLDALWNPHEGDTVSRNGILMELSGDEARNGSHVAMPRLPLLSHPRQDVRGGFTIDFGARFDSLEPGQVLFDARDGSGKGVVLSLTDRKTIELSMCGTIMALPGGANTGLGLTTASWDCDPGLIDAGGTHHVAVIVDGGPKIVSFVVDGILCDGGDVRPNGWARFHPGLCDVNGSGAAVVAPALSGEMRVFRLYGRALMTSEAVGNHRADASRR